MNQIVEELKNLFEQRANQEKAQAMSAYMKNHFSFYGLPKPVRAEISKSLLNELRHFKRNEQWELIHLLWNEPEREMQYSAMELLRYMMLIPKPEDLMHIEALILSKSWWDSVDILAPHGVGVYLLSFPGGRDSAINRYINSDVMWLKRTALIFQLMYKEKTDQDLLFYLCRYLVHEKEFFIRKAIGWALRQYARTNPNAVLQFVQEVPLSNLSRKEATKHLMPKSVPSSD